jgi:hypothetical protein
MRCSKLTHIVFCEGNAVKPEPVADAKGITTRMMMVPTAAAHVGILDRFTLIGERQFRAATSAQGYLAIGGLFLQPSQSPNLLALVSGLVRGPILRTL